MSTLLALSASSPQDSSSSADKLPSFTNGVGTLLRGFEPGKVKYKSQVDRT
jgi:hypothetical protein